jgi:RecB family endonuclease NucS
MGERDLEAQIVNHSELLGEDLLVLGSQLAEFAEDRDRLDVLAVDRDGELVLVELKVDDAFRVTDLQALAYASAYSTASPAQLARTFARSLPDNGDASSTEQARALITEFVSDLEEFEDWKPSRQVRIKLVAPSFPVRVLSTVKWLGDVYGMRWRTLMGMLRARSAASGSGWLGPSRRSATSNCATLRGVLQRSRCGGRVSRNDRAIQ